jgi:hypothetical protein
MALGFVAGSCLMFAGETGMGQPTATAPANSPATAPAASIPERFKNEWDWIMSGWHAERDRIKTLQVRYEVTLYHSPPRQIRNSRLQAYAASSSHYKAYYLKSGDKYLQDTSIQHVNAGIQVKELDMHRVVGFNGTSGWQRQPAEAMAIRGARPAVYHPSIGAPVDVAMLVTQDTINEGIAANTWKLDSVSAEVLNGDQTIRVNASVIGAGSVTLWLAPEKGWLALRTRQFTPVGAVYYEANLTEMAKIRTGDGEQVVFPVVAEIDVFDPNGNKTPSQKLQVDRESIRINEPIDPKRFEFTAEPGERVTEQ